MTKNLSRLRFWTVTEQWKARAELQKAFEEVKQRTETARRSERDLRDVVNAVPAHVWRTSPEGEVDFVNDRWLQFTGLALDESFGSKWEAVVHPDDRTRVVADWHAALKNGRDMESEARVRRADGAYCWWFVRDVPLLDETGKLVRWYGTAIDIEDRKIGFLLCAKRKEDIPMLVEYFVKRYAEETGKQICKIDSKTLEVCQSYPWPGNIRQLQNIVERSVILCGGDTFGSKRPGWHP